MLFNSFHFVAFFAVVFPVAVLLRRRVRPRNWFLLAASYYFYGCWDWRYLSLILVSTLVDYGCGRALEVEAGAADPARLHTRRRRAILLLSLVTNLGILGFFKYCDFFLESAAALLESLGLEPHFGSLRILLPVGISFYTFQTLSYTIDVYRGKVATEKDLGTFALFVAFFPQLVAGPIERAAHLLPQLERPREITRWHVYTGCHLIGWGLFKKVVLADNCARLADSVFAGFPPGYLGEPSGLTALLGVYAFALQIYCDFSGYTDIARGTARCLGFDLMRNFDTPYLATNPADFWRRWHISLSTWLRDYLYIPLGGNRCGPGRTYRNLMITMLLGGLWHGAAWTFVLWGLFHGVLLSVHRVLEPRLSAWHRVLSPARGRVLRAACMVGFFHLTCVGWLLFRAESFPQLRALLGSFAGPWTLQRAFLPPNGMPILAASALLLLAVQIPQYLRRDAMLLFKLPLIPRTLVYAGLLLAFLLLGEYGETPFLYFQF